MIVKQGLALKTTSKGVDLASPKAKPPVLLSVIKSHGISLRPLFGASPERLNFKATSLKSINKAPVPDLSVYYRAEAPDRELDKLAKVLRNTEEVKSVYIKPPSELPQRLNEMAPLSGHSPPVTPDFTPRQGYLDAAPGGIDARYAWTLNGGRGAGIRIIDVEGEWKFSHEDLLQNQGGIIGGNPPNDVRARNHGTAVVGEFGADINGFGVTGISPDSNVKGISVYGIGSAAAIVLAATSLRPGDIILIELHRAGPRFNFKDREDQRGYIAIEWWPDDFDAIQFATSRDIIVVEAAGNGAESLDDPIYSIPDTGFPTNWTNPFNRANRDSGVYYSGAGAPPSNNFGPDRSRLDFSNYGAVLDAQGWGREVVTTGYGDLQGGDDYEDLWYTSQFAGTSSASPIVVGALSCVQGVLHAKGRPLMTPADARRCLRATGSVQQDAPGRPASQRIGNRSNIRQLLNCAGPSKVSNERLKEKD